MKTGSQQRCCQTSVMQSLNSLLKFGHIFLVILLFPGGTLFADCSISRGNFDGYETVVLENSLIRVVVIPDSSGRIAEFALKPAAENLFPQLQVKRFPLTSKVELATGNFAGFEDWIWEIGLVNRVARYQCKVIRETKESCVVQLTYAAGALYHFERTLTIGKDSAELLIETQITNPTKEPKEYSYWAHMCVLPGQEKYLCDTNKMKVFAPTGKDERKAQKTKKLPKMVAVEKDTVFEKTFSGEANDFFVPRQGWWAMFNQPKKAALIQLVPLDEIAGDGCFYTNSGNDNTELPGDRPDPKVMYTMELIYSSQTIPPGGRKTYHLGLVACNALSGMTYAGKYLLLDVPQKIITLKNGTATIPFQISSPRLLSQVTLEVLALTTSGKEAARCQLKISDLTPRAMQEQTATLSGLTDNDYQLQVRLLDRNGGKLEETTLLGITLAK